MARGTLDAARVRKDFPILDRTMAGKPLVYLDSAATAQKPRQVIEAETKLYEESYANVHRGIYPLAEEATEAYEAARRTVARFLGAPDPRSIVFTRGTTESINLVAHAWGRKFLRSGDEIVLTEMEHHSNIVPWQLCARDTGAILKYVGITDDGLLDPAALAVVVTERTKLVAITGQSNVLGTLPPIREVADIAHGSGALLLIDGAQLVAHNPVDVVSLDVDFLAFTGHKMLGPSGSGGLYGRPDLLEAMDPFHGGGEMIVEVYPDRSTYKDPPWKFEAGTPPIAQEIGLAAAVEYLEDLGMDAVRDHERALTAYAIEGLTGTGATIFGPTDPAVRGGAVSFAYRDIHPHDIAQVLGQAGVAVRAGHHCAQILMRRLGVPATARASFHVYSTTEDVDRLVEALDRVAEVFG